MSDAELAEKVLTSLVNPIQNIDFSRLETLLNDFVAGAILGERKYGSVLEDLTTGMTERAVRLGLYSSAADMDDIDWQVITHPGSVIWPAAISAGIFRKLTLEEVETAAAYGYRTGATIAKLFGASHRAKWHVTSTSGAFAAATTASVAMGLSSAQHLNALRICGANIGGSPQAGFERHGAAQSNRAAAIALGITSAHSAAIGAPHVKDIWTGPRGLFEMFSVEAKSFEILDGVSSANLRLLPTNGFTHSAVLAAWKLRERNGLDVSRITVVMPISTQGLLDGTLGGTWWDPKFAIAALWQSGDPLDLSDASNFLPITHLIFENMSIGTAKVIVETTNGADEELVEKVPEDPAWITSKWSHAGLTTTEENYLRCSNFPLAALR